MEIQAKIPAGDLEPESLRGDWRAEWGGWGRRHAVPGSLHHLGGLPVTPSGMQWKNMGSWPIPEVWSLGLGDSGHPVLWVLAAGSDLASDHLRKGVLRTGRKRQGSGAVKAHMREVQETRSLYNSH